MNNENLIETQEKGAKAVWSTPEVKTWGTVAELTQTRKHYHPKPRPHNPCPPPPCPTS